MRPALLLLLMACDAEEAQVCRLVGQSGPPLPVIAAIVDEGESLVFDEPDSHYLVVEGLDVRRINTQGVVEVQRHGGVLQVGRADGSLVDVGGTPTRLPLTPERSAAACPVAPCL